MTVTAEIRPIGGGTIRAKWKPPGASSVMQRDVFRSELARALATFAARFRLTVSPNE